MSENEDRLERVLQAIELPEHERRPRVGQPFPDLELTGEDGTATRPLGTATGPLLLVFFRGFW